MLERSLRVSRRVVAGAAVAGALTVGAAGAATFHRLAVSQTTGSEGATAYLQTDASSSALQGQVGSSVNTAVKLPFGVLGQYNPSGNTFGIGVVGLSSTGYGVGAESFGQNPSLIALAGGVENVPAFEAVASATGDGYPVVSQAYNGNDGGDFYSTGGTGLFARSYSASSANMNSGSGLYVENESTQYSAIVAHNTQSSPSPSVNDGGGILTYGTGPGVYAESTVDPPLVSQMDCGQYVSSYGSDGGFGGQVCAGLYVVQDTAYGWPLLVYNASTQKYPFLLQANGDLTLLGSITQNSDAKQRTAGTDELSYTPKETETTVEDFGTAQLRAGAVDVPLQADFRETMNASKPYMVFLTPHGDNRGLYVASMTPLGFSVRESQGGRSTLAFDYRIVARPAGALPRRLPRESQITDGVPARPDPRYAMTAAQLHARALRPLQTPRRPHPPKPYAPTSLWDIPRR